MSLTTVAIVAKLIYFTCVTHSFEDYLSKMISIQTDRQKWWFWGAYLRMTWRKDQRSKIKTDVESVHRWHAVARPSYLLMKCDPYACGRNFRSFSNTLETFNRKNPMTYSLRNKCLIQSSKLNNPQFPQRLIHRRWVRRWISMAELSPH